MSAGAGANPTIVTAAGCRPTRRLIVLAGVALLLAAAVPFASGLAAVWPAFAAAVAALALVDRWSRPTATGIDVELDAPRTVYVGRSATARIRARFPPGTARSQFAVRAPLGLDAAVRRGESTGLELALELPLRGTRRGPARFGAAVALLTTRLGLLEHRYRITLGVTVAVAPGRPRGETAWLIGRAALLEEAGPRPYRRIGAGQEFESLREYAIGDELRRLDWKASARRNRPLVREFEIERNAEVVLALDCGRLMGGLVDGVPKLDLAMTPLLDLAALALRQQERVGLLCFDSSPRSWLPPRGGMATLGRMTEELASIEERLEPTSYLRMVAHLERRHRKRAFVVVFTDFTDEISAEELYRGLGVLGRRHRMVFVAVRDPVLDRELAVAPSDEAAAWRQATAAQLLVERGAVLGRIERLGIPALDATPARLSAPLIARWLEVRDAGLG